jgi:hypothetical protein
MQRRPKYKQLFALVVFALILVGINSLNKQQMLDTEFARSQMPLVTDTQDAAGSDVLIVDAFNNGRSNVQLGGIGQVSRLLPDDNEGSRHQKFLITLESGHSLLISHNIDLAPRIDNLRKGDTVEFYGEYEWNNKGGLIHWTHHDPKGKHPGGWIKHRGKVYQ